MTCMTLSPGFTIRAVGRDFDSAEAAESHAREFLADEPAVESVNLFLVGPGCLPAILWAVRRPV